MLIFTRISKNLKISIKSPLNYMPTFPLQKLLVTGCMTTHWVGNDERATMELSMHSCIPSNMWLTHLFLWSLLIASNEAMHSYRRSDIVYDLKIARMSLRGSITMQCGLSRIVCRLPRERGACANIEYQGLFPSSPHYTRLRSGMKPRKLEPQLFQKLFASSSHVTTPIQYWMFTSHDSLKKI